MGELKHDPRKLKEAYFSLAKRWWGASLICKFSTIIAGVTGIWMTSVSKVVPIIIVVLGIISEVFSWRSDKAKGIAESLLRKLDFRNSFGWEISREEIEEIRDILAQTPNRIKARIPPENQPDTYFASKDGIGSIRALKNIQESAWWSQHLSKKMCRYTLVPIIISILTALLLLLFSINTGGNFTALSNIGRIITFILMLIISLGLVRLAFGYYAFSQNAQRVEQRAKELLRNNCTEIEVIKLWAEYQINRASAPLVPDLVYRRNKPRLNELWAEYQPTDYE